MYDADGTRARLVAVVLSQRSGWRGVWHRFLHGVELDVALELDGAAGEARDELVGVPRSFLASRSTEPGTTETELIARAADAARVVGVRG